MSESNPELSDLQLHKKFSDQGPPGGTHPAPAVDVEGRCGDCWGQVAGHKNEEGRWARLECRVCGLASEGEAAHREMQQLCDEATMNLSGARVGKASRYRKDGRFFLKLLPDMVRDVATVDARMEAKRKEGSKRGYFTRNEFRDGDAGNFYFQACALVGGLEQLSRDFGLIPPLSSVLETLKIQQATEDKESGRKRLLVQGELEAAEPDLVRKRGPLCWQTWRPPSRAR